MELIDWSCSQFIKFGIRLVSYMVFWFSVRMRKFIPILCNILKNVFIVTHFKMCFKWKSDKQNCIYWIKSLRCETKKLVLKTELIAFFSNIILFLLNPVNCSSKSKTLFDPLAWCTLKVGRREPKCTLAFLNVPDLSGKCYLKHISYLNMFVLTNIG